MTEHNDDHPVIPLLTQKRRAYLYRVAAAVFLVLLGKGLIDAELAENLDILVASLLSVVASANTPTAPKEDG